MPYPEELIAPLREELLQPGITELRDGKAVDEFMAAAGTTLIFFNSVCGTAGPVARPALGAAIACSVQPDRIGTVFAGQDVEATERARSYCPDLTHSSPSAALFKDGELVHFIPRGQIKGASVETVAELLTSSFEEFCG